jgi:glycogen synthase
MTCLTHQESCTAALQGYAWEITTAEGGWGLDKVLQARQHVLNGITNGIDLDEWDPEFDKHTVAPYSSQDLGGKAACKEALQRELGLEVNPDVSALFLMSLGKHWHVEKVLSERWCE